MIKKMGLLFAGLLFAISTFSCRTESNNGQIELENKKNYLLLFTFQGTQLSPDEIASAETIKRMNESPYDGFAVPVRNSGKSEKYEAPDYENERLIRIVTKILKQKCKKDLWPTLSLNCIVKYDSENCHNSAKNIKTTMSEIPGMDLDNETGRLEKFLEAWKNTLQWAKELKSPGVIFDHEYYNNYPMKHMDKLAAARNEKPEITVEKLKKLGHKMAEICAEIYPNCKILILETKLYEPYDQFRPSYCYPMLGILEEAKGKNIPLTVIDGGESSVGYLHSSLEEMQKRIKKRLRTYTPLLKEYPNFKLAGCIAPFVDKKSRPWWMTNKRSPQFPCEKAEEFLPFIEKLLENYRFVWIYGGNQAYVMFNMPNWPDKYKKRFAKHPERMNKVIEEAKKEAKFAPLSLKDVAINGQDIPTPPENLSSGSGNWKLYCEMKTTNKNIVLRDHPAKGDNQVSATNISRKIEKINFPLEIKYNKWNGKSWEWPGFTVYPAKKDMSDTRGIGVAIYNSSPTLLGLTMDIRGNSKKEYAVKVIIPPQKITQVIIPTHKLADHGMDIKNITAISFIRTRPKESAKLYFSNIKFYPHNK